MTHGVATYRCLLCCVPQQAFWVVAIQDRIDLIERHRQGPTDGFSPDGVKPWAAWVQCIPEAGIRIAITGQGVQRDDPAQVAVTTILELEGFDTAEDEAAVQGTRFLRFTGEELTGGDGLVLYQLVKDVAAPLVGGRRVRKSNQPAADDVLVNLFWA